MRKLYLLFLITSLLSWSCDDDTSTNTNNINNTNNTNINNTNNTNNTNTAVNVTFNVQGITSCGNWPLQRQSGLNYIAPDNVRTGVMSLALLKTHKDPAPTGLSLSDDVVPLDISNGDVIYSGPVPDGTYTHMVVGIAWSEYEIPAMGHSFMDIMGTLRVNMAMSSHESTDFGSRSQGQYTATFEAMGQSQDFSGSTEINCVISNTGGIASTTGNQFSVRVPIPGGPLVIDSSSNNTPQTVSLEFPLADTYSFRDKNVVGFVDGTLDISQTFTDSELPDSLFECNLFMSDRCTEEGTVPISPTWAMPDSRVNFCTDGTILENCPDEGSIGYGQDAVYSVNPMDYSVSDGIVTDNVTGLMWQRGIVEGSYDWWEARDACHGLELGGYTDWRLPSRIELVSIVDFGALDPTIDLETFPGTPSDFFWSGSPVPFLNMIYGVRFELGFIYDHDPYSSGRVRCVRSDYNPPTERFTHTGNTVVDNSTGLIWQLAHHETALTWLDALDYCENLELDGFSDWRMPKIKELQTILDERRLQPTIDVVAFPGTPSEWFWSSTPIMYPPDEAWCTSFTDGYASIHAFTELHLVRCVR